MGRDVLRAQVCFPLTALAGGDEVVCAKRAVAESVRVALHELERYTPARIGNVDAPETTGKFIAATFEHDTARPVERLLLHRSFTLTHSRFQCD